MRILDVTVKRNDKSLFKKIDIKVKVEALALHLENGRAQAKLWDYDYTITKDPEKIKKYSMHLKVYFLDVDDKPPVQGKIAALRRKFRIRGLADPNVNYVMSKRTKKKMRKENNK